MKKGDFILNIIGSLFILLGIIAIFNSFYYFHPSQILWFCYIGIILLGIGVLYKNSFLVKAQLNILLIPLIIWSFDFFYYVFAGHSLFQIVDYMFESGPVIPKLVSLQHIFTVPLSIYCLFKLKKTKNDSWKLSMIQISILFLLAKIFTNYEDNINWVYKTNFNLNIPFYPFFWFIGVFLIIFLTEIILNRIHLKKN